MKRTKSGLPKHCSWNTDRHGKRRVRFRKDGFTAYLTGTPWSEEFMRQYATALDGTKATENVGAVRTLPGTFNALAVSYYKLVFPRLRPTTQRGQRNLIERLRREHGDRPLKDLKRKHVEAIHAARADAPEAANSLLKVLRTMLQHAVEIEMLASNPAIGVKKFKSRGGGFHTWSEAEIAQFEARHPVGSKARLAMALLLCTAQRRSDVIRLGWQHVRGDLIAVRQEKTDRSLLIPIGPPLQEALAAVPRSHMTFLVTEHGAPFSVEGFGNWFRARCSEAGLPQCSPHGLRKAAATRLANAGCSAEMIKAITGHKTLSEVARYTEAADQERLARAAMRQMETEREQKLSSPATRLDKTAK